MQLDINILKGTQRRLNIIMKHANFEFIKISPNVTVH